MSLLRMSRRRMTVVGLGATVPLVVASMASAAITSSTDAVAFGGAVVSNPASLTGGSFAVNYPCVDDNPATTTVDETSCPMAVSTTPMAGFPTNGGSYGILSTGNAAFADDPNSSGSLSKNWGVTGLAIGADVYDYQHTQINLGPATGSCLAFDFRFFSEEYNEYVNAGYNDAFIAQLNQLAVNVPGGGQEIIAPGNFAAGAGDQISVDSSGPSAMNDANAAGTTYDGATLILTARTAVAVGSTNTLYLTLFDQGDGILDSAVFVDNLRYETLPAGQCKSLANDPDEGGTSTSATGATVSSDGGTISIPAACNLPPGQIPCSGNIGVTATPPTLKRTTAPLAAGVVFASGAYSIPAGQSATITLPVTAAGKAFAKAAKEKPAKLKKQAKKLSKKAAKLAKKADAATGKKAEKLAKKAKKTAKKAKKTKKLSKKLAKADLGTLTVTFSNPRNGGTNSQAFPLPRKK